MTRSVLFCGAWDEGSGYPRTAALRQGLLAQGFADDELLKKIEDSARAVVEDGVQFALDAPYPDPSQVTEDVFA